MSLTSSIYLHFTFKPNIWFLISKPNLLNLLFSGKFSANMCHASFCRSLCLVVSISKVPKWNIHIWNFVQRHPQKSFDVFKFNAGQSSPDNLWVTFSISVHIPILLIYTAQKSKTKYKLSLFASYFMIGCERMLGLSCVFHIYLDTNTHTIYLCLSYLS